MGAYAELDSLVALEYKARGFSLRHTMLVVDQRINMFFGSRKSMKSVVAAEIAALAAWRVFQQGDRVGAFVFNDSDTEQVRMHRSRATVLRILDRIAHQNHLLRGDLTTPPQPGKLNQVLDAVARICHHDALILIPAISTAPTRRPAPPAKTKSTTTRQPDRQRHRRPGLPRREPRRAREGLRYARQNHAAELQDAQLPAAS